MRYKFTDANMTTRDNQTYCLNKWTKPIDGLTSSIPGEACGPGSLHLMKMVRPTYAPSKYRCFEAEGKGLLGEDAEKARYRMVRLLRELSPIEIDQGIDNDWAVRLGRPGLYLPIAWARTASYLDRPIDREALGPVLSQVATLLGKPSTVIWVGDSLQASPWDSLGDSLRASPWNSPFYERGYAMIGKPKDDLVVRLMDTALEAGLKVMAKTGPGVVIHDLQKIMYGVIEKAEFFPVLVIVILLELPALQAP